MNILITGVGPHNKGAELMLLAILDQLRQRLPDMRPVITPGGSSYLWRAKLGVYQLFDTNQSGYLGWLRLKLLHQGYRDRFGLVLPEQIDAVLDASGYAFGDPWKLEHIEGAAATFERYKRLGARVILLPQAFGPFTNGCVRAASRRILAAADLVFARDPESLGYCKAIVPEHPEIHQAPDFTSLLQGTLPNGWIVDLKHVALVPNGRMLSESDSATARHYVPVFAKAVERINAAGYHPFVLVHESKDPKLANEIVQASGINCPVIDESDSLAIKGILGNCAFTIGSRFHGLVSALSQGIPCIGTSWSHKYRHLFEEYGIPDWLCTLDDGGKQLMELLDKLYRDEEREELVGQLRLRASTLRREAYASWDFVVSTLGCTA